MPHKLIPLFTKLILHNMYISFQFSCCGVTGPSDYTSKGQVPFSCCGQGPLDSIHKPYASDCAMLYQRGCAKPLHDYAREQLLLVAMTALGASILQVSKETSLILSCFF